MTAFAVTPDAQQIRPVVVKCQIVEADVLRPANHPAAAKQRAAVLVVADVLLPANHLAVVKLLVVADVLLPVNQAAVVKLLVVVHVVADVQRQVADAKSLPATHAAATPAAARNDASLFASFSEEWQRPSDRYSASEAAAVTVVVVADAIQLVAIPADVVLLQRVDVRSHLVVADVVRTADVVLLLAAVAKSPLVTHAVAIADVAARSAVVVC